MTEMRPTLPIFLLMFPLLVFQSGCGAIANLNAAATPLQIYELPAPEVDAGTRRRSVELVVEEPVASGAIATDRIMIRPEPLQAQYLPGVRWPDPAQEMVQTMILRTLLQTGALASVGRRPIGTLGDFALLSELTDFQAEAQDGGPFVVRVRLIARLARERDARVIATRGFEATANASSDRPDDVVAAFDEAAGQLVSDVALWTLARLGG
jgi:cholesterol transport system auxiliary component